MWPPPVPPIPVEWGLCHTCRPLLLGLWRGLLYHRLCFFKFYSTPLQKDSIYFSPSPKISTSPPTSFLVVDLFIQLANQISEFSGYLAMANWRCVHANEQVRLIREFICLSCTWIYQITLSDHSLASDLFFLCSSRLRTSKQLTSQRAREHIIILICLNVPKMAAFQLTFWEWKKVGVI